VTFKAACQNLKIYSFGIASNNVSEGILVKKQIDALFQCIYFTSLHVSSNPVLTIKRINCFNTSFGIYHSVRGDCLVCRSGRNSYAEWYIPNDVLKQLILLIVST